MSNNKYTFKNDTVRRANPTSNTQRTTSRPTQQTRPVGQTRQQQTTRPVQQSQPTRRLGKEDLKNPNPNATQGCLSFMLAFWFRSAVLSLAIYLAMRFLGLIGGNDLVLKRESLEGPVIYNSQEYELTDADLEAFTALMNDELLTEEQKEYIYSLNK